MKTMKIEDKITRMSKEYVKALKAIGLTQEEVGTELLAGGMIFLNLDRADLDPDVDLESAIQALKDR